MGKIPGKLLHVPLFPAKVELPSHHPAKLGHDRLGAVVVQLGEAVGDLGQTGEDVQVDGHFCLDPGVLHLDRHHLPRLQPGSVNLANGGRRQGLPVELLE